MHRPCTRRVSPGCDHSPPCPAGQPPGFPVAWGPPVCWVWESPVSHAAALQLARALRRKGLALSGEGQEGRCGPANGEGTRGHLSSPTPEAAETGLVLASCAAPARTQLHVHKTRVVLTGRGPLTSSPGSLLCPQWGPTGSIIPGLTPALATLSEVGRGCGRVPGARCWAGQVLDAPHPTPFCCQKGSWSERGPRRQPGTALEDGEEWTGGEQEWADPPSPARCPHLAKNPNGPSQGRRTARLQLPR